MNRNEKIKMLQEIQSGRKTIKEVLPKEHITAFEQEKGLYLIVGSGRRIREVKSEQLDEYIKNLISELPMQQVVVEIVDFEEWTRLNEWFESNY